MTDANQNITESRDRFSEGREQIMSHFSDKIMTFVRHPDFIEKMQSILDPLISHVINRVFPYILLCSILFLVMLLVTVSTFIIVVRSSLSAFQNIDMAIKVAAPE